MDQEKWQKGRLARTDINFEGMSTRLMTVRGSGGKDKQSTKDGCSSVSCFPPVVSSLDVTPISLPLGPTL